MKYAANLDKLREAMEKRGISPYKLAQLCHMPSNTLYSHLNGSTHMGEKTCAALADVLEYPVSEIFPEMVEDAKGKAKEPVPVPDDGKRRLTSDDMVVGCQTMQPEDGVTLSVRTVRNDEGREFSGYTLTDNDCVTVKTGVSVKNLDLDKIIIRTKKKMALEHHIFALSTPYEQDRELAVVVHSHGPRTLLSKGVEFAEIVFL